jgi:hypothetical protein
MDETGLSHIGETPHQSKMTTISLCLPTTVWTCGWIGSIVGERFPISRATLPGEPVCGARVGH